MTLPSFLDVPETPGPAVAVLPLPYEGTVSWGPGAAAGPEAFLRASAQVELWDEVLAFDYSSIGISTLPPAPMPASPADAVSAAELAVSRVLDDALFPLAVGGEHSLSYGVYRALAARNGDIGVIQLDAHADLRDSYQGSTFSHACVMARIRSHTDSVLQLGIRSLSAEEARLAAASGFSIGYMHLLRDGSFDLDSALARLPDAVFITFDVDALDLSLVRSTGTPEPGGFTWPEINRLLRTIFSVKHVVGFDVMELSGGDPPSAFTVARLAARMLGLRFSERLQP
ncbi:MAG: agmatinase [Planctomycetes bacterium]|nr:agmatinase [Planctomycetota bacterium]